LCRGSNFCRSDIAAAAEPQTTKAPTDTGERGEARFSLTRGSSADNHSNYDAKAPRLGPIGLMADH